MGNLEHLQPQRNHATSPDVPIGYAVLDTACLTSCGGGKTLDQYIGQFGVSATTKKSRKIFKGVNDGAPVPAENETALQAGLCGKSCELKVQRLPDSTTPILLSSRHFSDLGTIVHCRDAIADFKALDLMNVPLECSSKGHLMVNIADWDKDKAKPAKPLVKSDTIAVWKAEADELFNTNGILACKMKKRLDSLGIL